MAYSVRQTDPFIGLGVSNWDAIRPHDKLDRRIEWSADVDGSDGNMHISRLNLTRRKMTNFRLRFCGILDRMLLPKTKSVSALFLYQKRVVSAGLNKLVIHFFKHLSYGYNYNSTCA